MFRQIPVLPVVVPIAMLALVALVWRLHRRDLLSGPRAAVALALCVYVAGVIANTVFPVYLDKPRNDAAAWNSYLALVPLVDYGIADALMNIAVFAPVGVLVPLLVARASWGRMLLVATVFSLVIETTQYVAAHFLGGGHVADVNDLMFNVAGAATGFGVLRLAQRLPAVAAAHDRFAWH